MKKKCRLDPARFERKQKERPKRPIDCVMFVTKCQVVNTVHSNFTVTTLLIFSHSTKLYVLKVLYITVEAELPKYNDTFIELLFYQNEENRKTLCFIVICSERKK
jgi:hypothetical protein